LTEWCASQIAARGWTVRHGECFAAFGKQTPRAIEVPGALGSDDDVARCLHEIGHLLDPKVRPRKPIEDWEPLDRHISIEGECFAWLAAADLAGRKWNSSMQATLALCLGSYRDAYVDPCTAQRRMIVDTIEHTATRLRRRGVVSLTHGGSPPVAVPASIRSLMADIEDWRVTSCPR
jgi:hypothetical protein